MEAHDSKNHDKHTRPALASLYRTGAAAAWIAALVFRRNLDAEWWLLRGTGIVTTGPAAAPQDVRGWFELLQGQPLLGLTLLNLFDLVNFLLVGAILLALAAALRPAHPAAAAISAALAGVGVAVALSTNQALALLGLSHSYAQAAGEAQRAAFLAAGQAALAIHQSHSYAGPGLYPGFLLVALAGLLLALAMRKNPLFSKRAAWTGILANGMQLGYYLVLALAPAWVFLPISISAVFLLAWYLQVGTGLWRLGRGMTAQAPDMDGTLVPVYFQ